MMSNAGRARNRWRLAPVTSVGLALALSVFAAGKARAQVGFGYGGWGTPMYGGYGLGYGGWSAPFYGGYGSSYGGYGGFGSLGYNRGMPFVQSGYNWPGYGVGWGVPGVTSVWAPLGYNNAGWDPMAMSPTYFGGGPSYPVAGVNTYGSALEGYAQMKLANAEANKRYAEAKLDNQKALNQQLDNYRKMNQLNPSYNYQTMARRFGRRAMAPIPRDQLVDQSGNVKWPETMPAGAEIDEAKNGVEQAVRKVFNLPTEEKPRVRDLVDARDRVESLAMLVQTKLDKDDAEKAAGLQYFLMSLDYALTHAASAGRGAAAAVGGQDIRPDDAPKTGGEVLKGALKTQGEGDSDQADRPAPKAEASPRTTDRADNPKP